MSGYTSSSSLKFKEYCIRNLPDASKTESLFEAQVIACLRGNLFAILHHQTEVGDKFVSISVTTIFWYRDSEERSLRAGINWNRVDKCDRVDGLHLLKL